MRPELPAGPQPLQVLHVSEQEEDVLALGMGLKQPVAKTTTAHAAIREPLKSSLSHSFPHIETKTSPRVPPRLRARMCVSSAIGGVSLILQLSSPPLTLNRDLIVPF